MILSIIVYTLTAIILYVLAKRVSDKDKVFYYKTGRTLSMTRREIVLSLIIFCFIAGARYNVGVDHLYYLSEYKHFLKTGSLIKDTFEPGFSLITSVFAGLHLHYFFFFAFWAFLQLFFIYLSCKEEKYLLPYIALNIMLGPYFLNWMNGIRQCVAMCFFVYAVRFIEEKKAIPFFLGIIIVSFIHRSAIILLPIFLLAFKPIILKNRTINFIVLLLCIIWGSSPTWISITKNAGEVLGMLGYDEYSNRYTDMIDTSSFREMVWGPSRISILLTEIVIIYFYPKFREYYRSSRKIDILFFIFFLGTCSYNLFVNTSHIFLRPIQYFTIMELPLSAYTLYYFKQSKLSLMYILMCLLLFSYIYFVIFKSVYFPSDYSEPNLYKFFFYS